MPFEIVRNDITKMHVDAIVNAASRFPQVNSGVNYAIHQSAGPALLEVRRKIGYIAPGTAAITPAFDLDAKYVIHAATPGWEGGLHGELKTLRSAYDQCLALAQRHGCESVAFPLLAAGNHGFPKEKALQTAVAAFSEFLLAHDMQIYLVVFGSDSVRLSERLVSTVAGYIDDNYVAAYEAEHSAGPAQRRLGNRMSGSRICGPQEVYMSPVCASMSLADYIRERDAGFTETLQELIRKSGQKNAAVYKKANISKQLFSKIINDPEAKPSKPTAIALAIALELDLAGTRDLIGRAGYALTNSSTFDLIIRYFIEHRRYNIIEINIALYDFDQNLLGG